MGENVEWYVNVLFWVMLFELLDKLLIWLDMLLLVLNVFSLSCFCGLGLIMFKLFWFGFFFGLVFFSCLFVVWNGFVGFGVEFLVFVIDVFLLWWVIGMLLVFLDL